MPDISVPTEAPHMRSDSVQIRTFIIIRWIAIFGQLIAITVAVRFYDLQLMLVPCSVAIIASTATNLVAMYVFPDKRRLNEFQLTIMFLFDLTQLATLLFLTGGLNNPFSLLILVPVAISATVLQSRETIIVGVVTLLLTTVLGLYYIPLRTHTGAILEMPEIFLFGFWVAILIGTVFLAIYVRRVTIEIDTTAEALLATQMALSREQKLTDLGGVIAAAAHELGTPLATIKLVSSELIDDLKDQPQQREDAELIREQTDRCRDILHSMGQAGKDDLHIRYAPVSAVIEEAAQPHMKRGKPVTISTLPSENTSQTQPDIRRQPEIIHGLRNLIQNAVDFANSQIWVDIIWTDSQIIIKIIDDGDGFPPHLIKKIGDPFVGRPITAHRQKPRPGYKGMGLGLFIAKTLLERSGGTLSFANGCDPFLAGPERPIRCGAIVQVIWPRDVISRSKQQIIGENKPIKL
ncbi:MAG: two-component sensor histidine kinase [Rhodobacterales bacterium]|nr:MAG: two-component sensor histidine kinase [Rhodobacterales bacterium]